jgi:hypothetical protein
VREASEQSYSLAVEPGESGRVDRFVSERLDL